MAKQFGESHNISNQGHETSEGTGQGNVQGQSENGIGLRGISTTGTGVKGESTSGTGIAGNSSSGQGIVGISGSGQGIYGYSASQPGVVGESKDSDGIVGISSSSQHAGVTGQNTTGGMAGFFNGNVMVTGTLTAKVDIVLGADCAEEFDIVAAIEKVEPGTVMVLDPGGALRPSQQAYDKKVAGVISGAGSYKPGIVLDKREAAEGRMPLALVGKVFCKVDAQYAPIAVGDLLTTSPTPGHAMKADDPFRAFGAVIGKALQPLEGCQGLIPILIALQ